ASWTWARERTWASALNAGSATRTSGTHTATRAKPCRRTSRKAGSTAPHHSGAPWPAQPERSAGARRRAGDAVGDLRRHGEEGERRVVARRRRAHAAGPGGGA